MNLNLPLNKQKQWNIISQQNHDLGFDSGLSHIQTTLLTNRGITNLNQINEFMKPSILHNPFDLPDMEIAITRIREAIRNNETVGIFGDFDTDGITGTAVLTNTLKHFGVQVIPYIPNRISEGHGLNKHSINALNSLGVSLLITVDCGSSSIDEIEYATSLGIEVIITDHHSIPQEMPRALAIINHNRIDSKYPFRGLAGVGVAFKLAEALYNILNLPYPLELLEFVALGTVADMVPLIGENRTLVHLGIKALNSSQKPGIKALIQNSRLSTSLIDSEKISFYLAPRLNAPGRLDDPMISLKLLTTASHTEAYKLASKIEKLNTTRKEMTAKHLEIARLKVSNKLENGQLIFIGDQGKTPGISGLIAGRLVNDYFKPAIYYCIDDNIVKGSARSIPQFNITDALSTCSDLFYTYGGHSQAAGFVMDLSRLEELEHRLTTVTNEALKSMHLAPSLDIDIEVSPSDLVGETFKFLQLLGPHGQGNPAPVFLTREATVINVKSMGANSDHLKIKLKHKGAIWDATAFWKGDELHRLTNKMDFVYNIIVDSWNGRENLRLNILDFKPS